MPIGIMEIEKHYFDRLRKKEAKMKKDKVKVAKKK
jgi:hypothetical protein